MNELMVYVEQIVRPICATQSRKLRMRTELLTHLQSTLDEERERFPGDERTAIERATRRLGEPAELTKTLQQSVPMVERVLLARLPVSRRLDHLEQRMARVPGQRGGMTLGHKAILTGVATLLAGVPLLISMYSVTTPGTPAIHLTASLLGALIGDLALLLASYRFVFSAADPENRLDWRGTLIYGAIILGLQTALMFFEAFAIADRSSTIGGVAISAFSTVALLTVSILIARRIGKLRRPYDEWLALKIAE